MRTQQQNPPRYTLQTHPEQATIEIKLQGVLATTASYQALADELKTLLGQNHWKTVAVDLRQVEAITSEGISFLLQLLSIAKLARAHLKLLNPQPLVDKVLKLTGMDKVFEIVSEK